MNSTLCELGVATLGTTAVSLSVSAEPLLTALIGFGISIVTLVGGELVKLAVSWLKKKREKIEKEETKDE